MNILQKIIVAQFNSNLKAWCIEQNLYIKVVYKTRKRAIKRGDFYFEVQNEIYIVTLRQDDNDLYKTGFSREIELTLKTTLAGCTKAII